MSGHPLCLAVTHHPLVSHTPSTVKSHTTKHHPSSIFGLLEEVSSSAAGPDVEEIVRIHLERHD